MFIRLLFLCPAILVLASCSAIGPNSVHHDRFDYNQALSDSWKEQTLLNIVRLRYADMPIFLEVASIVSGYTLEGSVNLTGNVSSENTVQGDFLTLGTGGKFTDRPTITYAPVTGEQFHQSFMTPVPPKLLLFLMESGWQLMDYEEDRLGENELMAAMTTSTGPFAYFRKSRNLARWLCVS